MSVQRMYLSGFLVSDFADIRPGLVLVEPVVPAKGSVTAGGIELPGQEIDKIPGTAALCYRVVAMRQALLPDGTIDLAVNPLGIQPGVVCVLRNAMIDPISSGQTLLVIDLQHILAVVDPKVLQPPLSFADLAEAYRGAAASLDDSAVIDPVVEEERLDDERAAHDAKQGPEQ